MFYISCTNQAECEELQKRVESLGGENQTLRDELQRLSEECEKLTSENNSIKVDFSYHSAFTSIGPLFLFVVSNLYVDMSQLMTSNFIF